MSLQEGTQEGLSTESPGTDTALLGDCCNSDHASTSGLSELLRPLTTLLPQEETGSQQGWLWAGRRERREGPRAEQALELTLVTSRAQH